MANRAPCLALQPASPHFGQPECPECYERRRFPSDDPCAYDRTHAAPRPARQYGYLVTGAELRAYYDAYNDPSMPDERERMVDVAVGRFVHALRQQSQQSAPQVAA